MKKNKFGGLRLLDFVIIYNMIMSMCYYIIKQACQINVIELRAKKEVHMNIVNGFEKGTNSI